jgi:phosphatidylethanolamine/phosphatidyl-N-methylethanolamine N-methyltransferase
MYKNKQFQKLAKKYSIYQDEGSVGAMMNVCHKNLEISEYLQKFNKHSKILEIGAGSSPHVKYVKHEFSEYYFLENSKFAINFLKKKYNNREKFRFKLYNGKKIPFEDNYFDRIIISHVLEHIIEPEAFLKEMMLKVKKNGLISISLPIDPGLMWRCGRFFLKLFNVKKKLNISNLEYDYMIATEHVNSIFNLISIIKYRYIKKIITEQYLPLRVKILDFNLFYNVTIKK